MTTFITGDITIMWFTLPHIIFHFRGLNIKWKEDRNSQPVGDLVT